ncbi:MAG: 4-hydroxybenzoate transporter PcaK [Syntrophorhabdus sp. PtaU1.Bin058]|nr:MAG: 4-hydroxybenzoate transporter PcaK [Syntrophorhabdus sp. PtaU1.Bin058]
MDPTIQVFDWLDRLKFNRFHTALTILTGLVSIAAGYNSQVVAYVVPLVIKEWHLTPLAAGTMISASHFGLMLGAIGFGMASDRLGRRKTIMLAVASLSVFSSAAYFAPNYEVFCLLRLLAGLGIGGAIPLSVTIVSEFAPSGVRARLLTASTGGFTLGWAVAGLVATALIPGFGWRSVLLMGLLPIFLLPMLHLYLPESVRFLANKMRYGDALREVQRIERIARCEPKDWGSDNFARPNTESKTSLKGLFRPGLRGMTLLVWGSYLFNFLAIYGLSTWLPSLLANAGFSLAKSFSYSIVQAIGSSIGGFFLGCILDAFGRKRGLCLTYFLGGLSVLWFGSATSEAALYAAGLATGIFVASVPFALHVVAGEIYPTHIRSTGAGWAYAVGRVGSICGPIIGGAIQMAGLNINQFFTLFSLPCFLCVLLVALYPVAVRKDALEAVTAKLLK